MNEQAKMRIEARDLEADVALNGYARGMMISAERVIDAPRLDVVAVLQDLEGAAERIRGIDELEILSTNAEFGVGTRWRETRTMMGKQATEVMEITDVTPGVGYRTSANSHGCRYVSEFVCADVDGGGTLVTMNFYSTADSLVAKLMVPLTIIFKGSLRKTLMADLDDIAASLES